MSSSNYKLIIKIVYIKYKFCIFEGLYDINVVYINVYIYNLKGEIYEN